MNHACLKFLRRYRATQRLHFQSQGVLVFRHPEPLDNRLPVPKHRKRSVAENATPRYLMPKISVNRPLRTKHRHRSRIRKKSENGMINDRRQKYHITLHNRMSLIVDRMRLRQSDRYYESKAIATMASTLVRPTKCNPVHCSVTQRICIYMSVIG